MADENPSEPPASKPFKLISQILSARGFVLGLAAIITAAASWFKAPDTTATKATYEVLVARINELSKENEANHNDLQSFIRAYIGVSKTETPPSGFVAPGPQLPLAASAVVTPLVRKKKSTPVDYFAQALEASPAPQGSVEPTVQGQGVEPPVSVRVQADVAQTVPTLSSREPPTELPPFDQVVQQAKKK